MPLALSIDRPSLLPLLLLVQSLSLSRPVGERRISMLERERKQFEATHGAHELRGRVSFFSMGARAGKKKEWCKISNARGSLWWPPGYALASFVTAEGAN